MTKLNISFSDFSAATQALGKAIQQNDKIFFVKCPKAGKVEINLHSSTFTVGAGCKNRDAITSAVEKAGFDIAKRAKGWTVVKIDGDALNRFCELYKVVEGSVAVLPSKSKATKAVVSKGKSTLEGMLNAAMGNTSKSQKSTKKAA